MFLSNAVQGVFFHETCTSAVYGQGSYLVLQSLDPAEIRSKFRLAQEELACCSRANLRPAMGKFWDSESESDCEDRGVGADRETPQFHSDSLAAAGVHGNLMPSLVQKLVHPSTGTRQSACPVPAKVPLSPSLRMQTSMEEDVEGPSSPKAGVSGEIFRRRTSAGAGSRRGESDEQGGSRSVFSAGSNFKRIGQAHVVYTSSFP